jgi:hypothetical protein
VASFFGIVQGDISARFSMATLRALYDDGNGNLNTTDLNSNINTGEQLLLSWLVGEWGGNVDSLPGDYGSDPFLKIAAVEYVLGLSVERHPEYAKQAGLGTKESYFNRAQMLAGNVMKGLQQPTSLDQGEEPENTTGITIDPGPRMYVPGPNGCPPNAGDFVLVACGAHEAWWR